MDDHAYVRALQAILSNPEPTGIDPDDPYGMADDGIDRHDGFGRDILVESLEVSDGDHGTELVVTFALALPPDPAFRQIPARAAVHLPFDREWRHLSGYDEPAAYAPEVANWVTIAAVRHVERHRDGRDWFHERDRARAALPDRDVQWRTLADALNREGRAVEVSPGRFELDIGDCDTDQVSEVVTIAVTPDEWAEVLATTAGGDADLYIAELLAPRDDDEHYVVFYDGDLVRSTREQLPPIRGSALARKLAGLRARDPHADFGRHAGPLDAPPGPEPPLSD